MLNIHVQTLHLWLSGNVPVHILEPELSYFVEGAYFAKSYKYGQWNGRKKFLWKLRGRDAYYTHSGFLDRICKALDKAEWQYSLTDEREFSSVDPIYELLPDISLRDYQRDALDEFLSAGRGILKLATGAGKTEIAAAAIKSINEKTVFFTHRQRLLYQTQKRLEERLGRKVGLIGDGQKQIEDVSVCMIQSSQLMNLPNYEQVKDYLLSCKFIIADEAHRVQADQWCEVLSQIEAPWRLGLTATPVTSGVGMSSEGLLGHVLVDLPAIKLIEKEVLVPPRIWFARPEKAKISKGAKWPTIYKEGIVEHVKRNEMIKDVCLRLKQDNKSVLVLVNRIGHGETLTDLLNYFGIRTEFMRGAVKEEDREKMFEMLYSGKLHCIVSIASLVAEGLDMPDLRAIVNATGSRGGGDRSEDEDAGAQTLQILGRVLRKAPGKFYADYVDFVDNSNKKLLRATQDRINTLESEGYGPLMEYFDQYE